jgi:hypothetical protein
MSMETDEDIEKYMKIGDKKGIRNVVSHQAKRSQKASLTFETSIDP